MHSSQLTHIIKKDFLLEELPNKYKLCKERISCQKATYEVVGKICMQEWDTCYRDSIDDM